MNQKVSDILRLYGEQIKERYLAGESLYSITKSLPCSYVTAHKCIILMGIAVRSVHPKRHGITWSEKVNDYGYLYGYDKFTGKHIRKHRWVMEQHLGRKLSASEIVHHKDRNKLNNSIENLEILTNEEHAAEHRKDNCPPTGNVLTPELESLLGTDTDKKIGLLIGRSKNAVRKLRNKRKIPPYTKIT